MSAAAPTDAPAALPEYPDRIDGAVLKVAGVVVLGAIMSILDITVVNVALPTFQQVFASNPNEPLAYSTVAWTVTAYTLSLATVIPLTGWAADTSGSADVKTVLGVGLMGGYSTFSTASSLVDSGNKASKQMFTPIRPNSVSTTSGSGPPL